MLPNVSWSTYQALLADLGSGRSTRLAYDRGSLEIIMPSDIHEILKHLLERIVAALTEEFELPIRGVGSVTLDREDLQKGAEPDAGFYIQNAAKVRGKTIDLAIAPPPDLIIEVDIHSSSSRRLQIYQDLGVGEVWRATEKTMQFYQLVTVDGRSEYQNCDRSPTFPLVTTEIIQQWLELAERAQDDNAMVRALRQWVRTQPTDNAPESSS
ncbi:Uma2 family endonuclease [Spirulina major]|uniref:Uma2 family endonuclease n=1 Tax=Spirulina major TaxID=270636 RepID=UPI00232B5E31|nr:Uma2 family endonuclease [Spirulina major]